MERALGLPQRQTKEQSEREGYLDRDIRIHRLGAAHAGLRRRPGVNGVLTQPQGDVAAIAERLVIFTPVFHAIRDLVFGISMESSVGLRHTLHRWLWVGHVLNMTGGSTGVKSRSGIRAPKPDRL